jgi:hypothetical protein
MIDVGKPVARMVCFIRESGHDRGRNVTASRSRAYSSAKVRAYMQLILRRRLCLK